MAQNKVIAFSFNYNHQVIQDCTHDSQIIAVMANVSVMGCAGKLNYRQFGARAQKPQTGLGSKNYTEYEDLFGCRERLMRGQKILSP